MTFIKGLQLSEIFYREAVGPILGGRFPGLAYSAARLDGGSDVLGFDTPRSMDHGWGPRLQLFLSEADLKIFGEGIVKMLGECLPYEFHGFSTNFSNREIGLGWMERITSGPICHGVSVHAVRPFLIGGLGCDPCDGLTAVDWLTIPEQKLRVISSGQIFHDGLGELKKIQAQLQYYPRDVWLYLLAAQWRRIDQEEPFMGRCGEVGDELGSRILTARLIRDVMKLCFLMERQYAPYSKWFGTAFSQLNCAGELTSTLIGALAGQTWQEREAHLSRVYESVAAQHDALGITPLLEATVSNFHNRPFKVIHSGRFVEAIRNAIHDDEVRRLPEHLGGVDQYVDSTDVLSYTDRYSKLRFMYS